MPVSMGASQLTSGPITPGSGLGAGRVSLAERVVSGFHPTDLQTLAELASLPSIDGIRSQPELKYSWEQGVCGSTNN